MTVYTIPATVSFVDAFADGILEQAGFTKAGHDPLALSAITILLPNRRAVRSLREAFLRKSAGRALLLPTIRPIGDVDEDALSLGPGVETLNDMVPVDPLRRQLVLAQYLNVIDPDRYTIAQALPMAAELGRFLDTVHTEGLSLDNLEHLVPDDYAAHWGLILTFLKKVVGSFWPRQLEKDHACDPGAYRNKMIAAYAEHLQENPPAGPVYAAGSTGSLPATADLLKVIAGLPAGHIVLPGLDMVLDDQSWNDDINEGHPQAGLQRLLNHLEITRADVREWMPRAVSPREHLISTLMRPAATLDRWTSDPLPAAAFDNLTLIEADTLDAEAAAIAALMRAHAQDRAATEPCVLVTPDRILGGRVAQYLTRWNIAIDDSAGVDLSHTPLGSWFLLLAELLHENLPPVEFLAALKHGLAAGGAHWPAEAGAYRSFVRLLDFHVLRGARPAPGFDGLYHRIRDLEHITDDTRKTLSAGLRALERLFAPASIAAGAPDKIRALVLLAENLAATPAETGAQRIWVGDAGEAAANVFSKLFEQNDVLPALDWSGVRAVLEAAMKGVSIRPRFGTHPRLAILGPIEARLYQACTMILSSLNEGTWPKLAEVDGWMSRPMRVKFGLPAPERAITLSSHDFCQGLGAPNVILTRSKNRDGAPTIPSRWLQRLDAVCTASGAPDIRAAGRKWLGIAAMLDTPVNTPRRIEQPVVNPPLDVRPKKLRVTEISKLRAEPYGIYARHVLGLSPIDPIDAEPDARERGNLIHTALEEFTRTFPGQLPDDAHQQLIAIGKKIFAEAHAHPDIYGHWWPRFQRMARALIAHENTWRLDTLHSWAEADAEMPIPVGGQVFTLRGRADRIERRTDGWAVIDYKSGGSPPRKDVLSGDEPQLTLLAAMLLQGAFNEKLGLNATPDHIDTLAYWPAGGASDVFRPALINADNLDDEARAAHEGLASLIHAYLVDGMPYICWPDPERSLRDDYEYRHLGRIDEWASDDSEAA